MTKPCLWARPLRRAAVAILFGLATAPALAQPSPVAEAPPSAEPAPAAAAAAAPEPAAAAATAAEPATATAPAADEPSPTAILFGKKCGRCHTLGEGDRAGPDLLGVTTRRDHAWLLRFIRDPNAMIDGGDKVANDLLAKFKGVRMPEQVLDDQQLGSLLDYIEACTTAGGCKITLGKIKHASEATAADIAAGRAMFTGQKRLAKGGAACISCHNVRGTGLLGGGTLAKDLTFVYARLGDIGLQAAISAAPFKLMKGIYAKRLISDAEAFQLKAFLADAAKDGTQPRADNNLIYLGVIGLMVALGAIGATWHGRNRGVRDDAFNGGSR